MTYLSGNFRLIFSKCNKFVLPTVRTLKLQHNENDKRELLAFLQKRCASTRTKKQLVEATERQSSEVTLGQKVKQAGKDASYLGVIVVGVGITGIMFYAIGRELFSKQSPSGVYGDALKLCVNNNQVLDILGESIKGYGETTRRGRRRHVSHTVFEVEGVKHMRMKFYLEGAGHRKATVHLEAHQNDNGKYEYRYLFVQMDFYPHRTVIIQDNR